MLTVRFALAAAPAALLFLTSIPLTDALNPNMEPPRKPGQIRPNEEAFGRKSKPSYASELMGEPRQASRARAKEIMTDNLIRKQLDDFADEDDFRMYVGTSLGENMKRDYVIDTQGHEMKEENQQAPHLPYYKMLGLTMAASQDEIKQSYRRLAKLYHPDANSDKDTTEQFNLLNRAYEVLTSPVLKRRYDKYGRRGVGTSAVSDADTSNKIEDSSYGIGRGYVQYQQIARSDKADVNWKGSRSSSPNNGLNMGLSNKGRTLQESRRKSTLKAAMVVTQNTPQRDLYTVLSVHKHANDDEIRAAYKKLSNRYYDDRNESKEAYIRYHEVERAYEVLRDSKLRKKYDLLGFQGLDKFRSASPRASIHENANTRSIGKPLKSRGMIQEGGATHPPSSVDPNPKALSARPSKRSIPKNVVLASHQSTIGRSHRKPKPERFPRKPVDEVADLLDEPVVHLPSPPSPEESLEEDIEVAPIPFPDLQPEAPKNKKKRVLTAKEIKVQLQTTSNSKKGNVQPVKEKVRPAEMNAEEVEDRTSAMFREMIDKSQNDASEEVDNESAPSPGQTDLAPIYDSASYWRSVTQIDPLPLHDDPVLDKRSRIEPVALTGSNKKKKEPLSRSYGRSTSRKVASRQLTQMNSMSVNHSSDQEQIDHKLVPSSQPAMQGKLSTSNQSRRVCCAASPPADGFASSRFDNVLTGQNIIPSTTKRKSAPFQNRSRHYRVDS